MCWNFGIDFQEVYLNTEKCCISLYTLGNQYIFVHLQVWTKFRQKFEFLTKFWTKLMILDG